MTISRHRILLFAIILLGGVLRFAAIGSKSVWLDEAFSVWVANHSPAEIWAWLIQIDQHPPLYYTLLHYWQLLFGDLQGAVRSLSALCGTLAIPFVYGAAKRLANERVGLIAALILALSPFNVRFGQEARMYALLTLGVAAALYFVVELLCNRKHSIWQWLGLIVAQAMVMWTHNTAAAFLPLALNLAVAPMLLWRGKAASSFPALERPNFGRHWLYAQVAVLLLWIPWLWPFIQQSIGVDNEFWISPPTRDSIRWTFHNFNFFALPGWIPRYSWWGRIYWAIAAIGLIRMRKMPARSVLLAVLFLLPPIISLLVSLRRPIFYDRTLIWITLPYVILLAMGIEAIAKAAQFLLAKLAHSVPRLDVLSAKIVRPVTYAPLLLIVFLSTAALYDYYVYYDKEEWDVAAAHVAQEMQPGDVILFNATWVQIPFEYYLRHLEVTPVLKGLPVDLFDRGVLEPKMTEDDLDYMRDLIADEPRLWLVYSHDWYTDSEQIILRELDRSMQVVDQREFVGLRVFRYEK